MMFVGVLSVAAGNQEEAYTPSSRSVVKQNMERP